VPVSLFFLHFLPLFWPYAKAKYIPSYINNSFNLKQCKFSETTTLKEVVEGGGSGEERGSFAGIFQYFKSHSCDGA
jgi:hypothetical protein